ncbi:MAG: pteridine reductase [Pseudomonadota bacterium]
MTKDGSIETSAEKTLAGKVALVTGSARRIGAEIVRTLHKDYARVAIHYRGSHEDARALAAELNAERDDSAAIFKADLLDTASLPALAKDVLGWAGRLDILVNNASTFYPTPLGSITETQWDDLIGSNLKAPLFLSQACLPALRDARGVIINLVDIHSGNPLKNHHVYSPAKAALAMLTRALAKDLGPEIRVNGVSPGAILWPSDGMSEEVKDKILNQVPLSRAGGPADIAGCVLYLIRDANYVSGQIIAVDGGRSAGW